MAEKVNPSPGRPAESFPTAGAIAYGGHGDDGFVRDGNDPTRIAIQDLNINEANLNTFDESHSASSLDVTIDPGEAFIFGAWVCTDESTTVTLDPSTSDQTVFVGWDKGSSDNVIIGLESAFTTTGADADRTIPLFDFDTDASGVTGVTDRRRFDQISADSIEQGAGSGLDADTVDGVEAAALGSDVSNDGTSVTQSATDIDFTTGLTAADDGDGTSTVSLSANHSDLSNIGTDDHHTRYSDEEAQDAIGTILGSNFSYDDVTPAITLDDNFVKNSGDAMTGDLQMGANSITNVADPANPKDAANKTYVDSLFQGLDIKESVRATSTSNVDLTSSTDPGPIDGVSLNDGDRILLKNQTASSENGVYDAVTAADPSTWIRASDVDEDDEVDAGMFVFVEEGTSFSNKGFVLVSDDPLVVGTDDLQFTQFSGAGQIEAGNALTKIGDTLDVDDAAIVSTINNETTLSVDISGDAVSVGGESYASIFGLTRRIQV